MDTERRGQKQEEHCCSVQWLQTFAITVTATSCENLSKLLKYNYAIFHFRMFYAKVIFHFRIFYAKVIFHFRIFYAKVIFHFRNFLCEGNFLSGTEEHIYKNEYTRFHSNKNFSVCF